MQSVHVGNASIVCLTFSHKGQHTVNPVSMIDEETGEYVIKLFGKK